MYICFCMNVYVDMYLRVRYRNSSSKIKKFIWSKKQPKIKHSTLIADYKDGGYKDTDIETKILSLKVKQISLLLDDSFHPWKKLYQTHSFQK